MPPGSTILMFFKAEDNVISVIICLLIILKLHIMSPLILRLYFKVGNFSRRSFSLYVKCFTVKTNLVAVIWTFSRSIAGVSNFSAMAGRIDFILGVAGHYAISAAVKAMFECEINKRSNL